MTHSLESIAPQLLWVCDALIPDDPKGELPSAVKAGVPTVLLPQALKARDDFHEPFISALSRLPVARPADPLDAIHALGEADFQLVSHLIVGAYFMSAEVNAKIGYPGRLELPLDPDYDEIMEVVTRVKDRGPVYTIF